MKNIVLAIAILASMPLWIALILCVSEVLWWVAEQYIYYVAFVLHLLHFII